MPSTYTETKKLRELNQHNKNKLKLTKIYMNKSLCPYYHKLHGKCNNLKKNHFQNKWQTQDLNMTRTVVKFQLLLPMTRTY